MLCMKRVRHLVVPMLLSPYAVLASAAELPPVVVTTSPDALLTEIPPTQREAGGVARVGEETYEAGYARDLGDVLAGQPGVHVQARYSEEVRLSIRGSGLGRNIHLRGVDLLVDDIPVNLADGSGDFQEIDPLLATHVDVYRGANAMSLGSATLGGAVRFVTPTARTMAAPSRLRFEVGSDDTVRLHAQTGGVRGPADGWLGTTLLHSDGWRDHARASTGRVSGNAGWRWTPQQETRAWLTVNAIDARIPGTVSREDALQRPRAASDGARDGQFARDIRSLRTALRHRMRFDATDIDIGGSFFSKRLEHPVPVYVDQDGDFYGLFLRARHRYDLFGLRAESAAGIEWREGDNDARVFGNDGGRPGPQFSDMRERADQLAAFLEQRLHLLDSVQLIASAQYLEASRRFDDRRSGDDDRIRYRRVSPRFGMLWDVHDAVQLFANVSASAEPPSFTELNQIRGAEARFVPLALQTARTAELGGRGAVGALSWDIALYRSWLRGELLAFSVDADLPAETFNAERTMHQGVEAAASWAVSHWLQVGTSWTLNDFRFADDRRYGDNRIAGVPRHLGRLHLRAVQGAWTLEPAWQLASSAEVDFANTLRAPGYGVLDVSLSRQQGGLLLFAELRNLFDRAYIATFSTVADAREGPTDVFYAGQGRRLFAGLRYDY